MSKRQGHDNNRFLLFRAPKNRSTTKINNVSRGEVAVIMITSPVSVGLFAKDLPTMNCMFEISENYFDSKPMIIWEVLEGTKNLSTESNISWRETIIKNERNFASLRLIQVCVFYIYSFIYLSFYSLLFMYIIFINYLWNSNNKMFNVKVNFYLFLLVCLKFQIWTLKFFVTNIVNNITVHLKKVYLKRGQQIARLLKSMQAIFLHTCTSRSFNRSGVGHVYSKGQVSWRCRYMIVGGLWTWASNVKKRVDFGE